jgi:hypothetical protein
MVNTMKVNSVNISSPQTIQQGDRAVTTAIQKSLEALTKEEK